MKILITPRSFAGEGKNEIHFLRDKGYEVVVNTTGKSYTEQEMIALCADVDGVIVGIDAMSEKVLRNAKQLKAISKYGAGLDNIQLDVASELGIAVDRAAGTNAVSVAEHAVGLFFALARSTPAVSADVKKGGWARVKGVELTGKTVGIIGLGHIGREVARICSGIGMKILGYDPFIKPTDAFIGQYDIQLMDMSAVFCQSDFITLHLPLTEETSNTINLSVLKTMKPGAFLVNTARGGLVDEDALYTALSEGIIAGAAQDVFSKEPPGKHKLLELDNFILTSHIGAYTAEANQKMVKKSVNNLVRMLSEGGKTMGMEKTFYADKLEVKIYETRAAMGRNAAQEMVNQLKALLCEKEELNIIFAAAPSQNEFIQALIDEPGLDWQRINAFHMDEYIGLAKDAPQGFGNFLRDRIFDKVPFKSINYLDGSADPQKECERYTELLKKYPTDIVCMGIGENGHIAFNDPHVAFFNDKAQVKVVELDNRCRQQQVNDGCFAAIDEVPTHALTLTIPALMASKYVYCMVPAKTKEEAVYRTVTGEIYEQCPASILRTHDNAKLFLDSDSGKRLLNR